MKKKIIIIFIFAIILLLLLFYLLINVYIKHILKKDFKNFYLNFANLNEKEIFKIDNITLFSSCDVKNKFSSASNFTIENLYQYTDIAIFLAPCDNTLNAKNTLKDVWIENIKFNSYPELGNPNLYFKSLNDFAKSSFDKQDLITNRFNFDISSENEIDLEQPILYNNMANPITLSYINENIKSDYTITNTSTPLTYDGSLLKKCNILLNSVKSSFSFDIFIKNNLDEEFKCTIFINIPLENDNFSIYDGKIIEKLDCNYLFFRYK